MRSLGGCLSAVRLHHLPKPGGNYLADRANTLGCVAPELAAAALALPRRCYPKAFLAKATIVLRARWRKPRAVGKVAAGKVAQPS